jgi:hypothetical protein
MADDTENLGGQVHEKFACAAPRKPHMIGVMLRLIFLFLALGGLPVAAQDDGHGPLISIPSPDTATTFVFGSIKSRALVWNDKTQTLVAEVTFQDEQQDNLQANDDTHRFRLPGVTLDQAHGIFYATSPKGEVIPVARRRKTLFLTTIQVLPNAVIRIFHEHGNVEVTLEAIRPSDVEKEKKAQSGQDNPDGTHSINLQSLLP